MGRKPVRFLQLKDRFPALTSFPLHLIIFLIHFNLRLHDCVAEYELPHNGRSGELVCRLAVVE